MRGTPYRGNYIGKGIKYQGTICYFNMEYERREATEQAKFLVWRLYNNLEKNI